MRTCENIKSIKIFSPFFWLLAEWERNGLEFDVPVEAAPAGGGGLNTAGRDQQSWESEVGLSFAS